MPEVIASHGRDGRQVWRGIEERVRSLGGACAVRVIEAAGTTVAEHVHDWPILSLYVMGDVLKIQDGGEVRVNRPAVALHGAGAAHANVIRRGGLEQVDIQFDPHWLGSSGLPRTGHTVCIWTGGRVASEAEKLRRLWLDPLTAEEELACATARLLEMAFRAGRVHEPAWLGSALDELQSGRVTSTASLARRLELHPGWLAQAYRMAVGEGVGQTVQRYRVGRAASLLRTTDMEGAAVAAEVGFCDQSHMIRASRRLLGRAPSRVRAERHQLQGHAHAGEDSAL